MLVFEDMGQKGGLFRYSDGIDKLLMLFGTLGSIGDGLMSPLTMLILSQAINEYGVAPADTTFSLETVNKVCDCKVKLHLHLKFQWLLELHSYFYLHFL